MAATREQLELWLADSTSGDDAVRSCATKALESVQGLPGFEACLLDICTVSVDVKSVAAATYLKNIVKSLPPEERKALREKLLEVLMKADGVVLKQLVEVFRIVASQEFAGKNSAWDELVPALRTAVLNSDLVSNEPNPPYKTLNVLLAIQAITRPFQYFLNPTVAREPVPLQLELISKELLAPLHTLFHHLVEQVLLSKETGFAPHDNALLVLGKCFHLAVNSHMPPSLVPCLGEWTGDILLLLSTVVVNQSMNAPEQRFRLKAWTRALKACATLISRHKKHIDKFLSTMTTAALKIVGDSTLGNELHPSQDRIVALAFDLLYNILQTGPGWRLLAPHFGSLLQNVIFPTLMMKQKDIVEWDEDADEYIRKNLPSDLDDSDCWSDATIPRRSAMNFLGLIATSKGPGNSKKATKRKKGRASDRGTTGELLVLPFLSQHPLPHDIETTARYYGVLLAYGALEEFLKTQTPEHVEEILNTRVFSLYSAASPSPYLLANANWLLGELAVCLPECAIGRVYDCLLKALAAENEQRVSWRPVRMSAAATLSVLLEEDYKPDKWFPMFHVIISSIKSGVEEASHLLQLLIRAAETGDPDIAAQVPYLVVSIKDEISKSIPSPPEPWPQTVEYGFSAIAALAHNWDRAEPDDSKKKEEALKNWKSGCITVVNTYSELLQRAWICSNKEEQSEPVTPAASCLNETSVVLGYLVKYASEPNDVSRLRIEQLIQVWSDLISEWTAWDEEEDLGVFDAIEEVIALNERCPLQHYAVSDVSSRSILEGMAAFVTSAMETAYSAATWRACWISHSLLHSTTVSFDGENATKPLISRFTVAAYKRLLRLSSTTVPLAKPLVLVIASCYIGLPTTVEEVLSAVGGDGTKSLLNWADALVKLAAEDANPGLALESELKLGVFCLVKLADRLVALKSTEELAMKCFESVLHASVRLRVLQEAEMSKASDEEDEAASGDTDGDSDDDFEDDSDDDDEREETEDEFLERYAETARELEEEVLEDAEGGTEEDGHEIELGVLALADPNKLLSSCIQTCGQLMMKRPLSFEVASKFMDIFPEFRCMFPPEYVQRLDKDHNSRLRDTRAPFLA